MLARDAKPNKLVLDYTRLWILDFDSCHTLQDLVVLQVWVWAVWVLTCVGQSYTDMVRLISISLLLR